MIEAEVQDSSDGREDGRWLVRVVLCWLAVVVAGLGLGASIEGRLYIGLLAIGASVGLIPVVIGRRKDLLFGEVAALSVMGFVVSGVAVAGGPSPAGLRAFSDGLVNGWAHWLSSSPPAIVSPSLRIVPLAAAWLGAVIGGDLIRRNANPVIPVVGPLVTLVVSILISVSSPSVGPPVAAALVMLALAASAVDAGGVSHREFGEERGGGRYGTVLVGVGLTVVVAAGSVLVGPRLPLAGQRDRFDLRSHQDRPWNPLDEPSPLVTLKAALKESSSEIEVLRVTADEPVGRLTLAVLSTYSGSVWSVADPVPGAPSRFVPVDRSFPSGGGEENPISMEVEVLAPLDPWVPLAGWPVRVGSSTDTTLTFNPETGTVASPAGLEPGLTLRVVSIPRPELTSEELARLSPIPNPMNDASLALVPPSMRNLAGDLFEGIDPGMDRIVALERSFVDDGFYDHSEVSRPGHSLARLDEFFASPDSLIGYSEQFAAGAAVLARVGDLPARVVVGYRIPDERWTNGSALVLSSDREAWIEIETAEMGWVPVDVTPDRSREPEQNISGTSVADVATPNPPPPPAPPPDTDPRSRAEASETADPDPDPDPDPEPDRLALWAPRLVAGAGLATPVLVLGGASVLVALLKRRRRRRRRHGGYPRDQVAGAWRELGDRLAEIGVEPAVAATPSEVAADTLGALAALLDDPSVPERLTDPMAALVASVDRAAFGPGSTDSSEADQAWSQYRQAAGVLAGSQGRVRRWSLAADPRPLKRGSPGAIGSRGDASAG